MLNVLKEKGQALKDAITDCSCASVIWMISALPRIGGFPLFSEKIFVPFWIVHISLAVYVYVFGIVFYQMSNIELVNAISSVFNILVVGIVLNNSLWFLMKRKEINILLKQALVNDALVMQRGKFLDTYRRLLKTTKIIIGICYGFHFINDGLIFIPSRIFDMSSFSIENCVGLKPLTVTPNKELCMVILAGQEITSIVVVASYDVICIFLFSHTTTMFLILCKEMEEFSRDSRKFDDSPEFLSQVREDLKNFVHRHSLVLLTVNKMQKLFNIAIGAVFIMNTISVCAFFILPLDVALNFAPLVAYTLTVFFLYCLQGQRLQNASQTLEMAVYSCGWENLRPREQKVILLMLKQAQKPVTLHAAGMVPIVLSTFASTVQTIYRFITVFRV